MAPPLTDFSTLTFDCYGTLIDWEAGIVAALAPWLARHGCSVSRDEQLAAFGTFEPRLQAATPAALYPEILRGVIGAMAARWALPLDDAEAEAFAGSVADWPAFADSPEALAYLKRHYKLAVISNIDRQSFAASNRRLGVAFDLVVTAQDVGAYKPDLRNFRYAFEKLVALGVAREQILHVAESLYHDHVPGKKLGLATVWVNRAQGRPAASAAAREAVTPDYEVPDLAALVELHEAELAG